MNSRTGFPNNLSSITYHSEQVILQLVTMKLISATFDVMLPFFGEATGLDSSGKRRLGKTCKCAPGCVGEWVTRRFVPVAQQNQGNPPKMRQSINKFVSNAASIVFDLLDKGLGLGLGRVRVREFRVCSSSVPEIWNRLKVSWPARWSNDSLAACYACEDWPL